MEIKETIEALLIELDIAISKFETSKEKIEVLRGFSEEIDDLADSLEDQLPENPDEDE